MLSENYVSSHSLADNRIGDEGVSELASGLKECQKLEKLEYDMHHCIYLIVTCQGMEYLV